MQPGDSDPVRLFRGFGACWRGVNVALRRILILSALCVMCTAGAAAPESASENVLRVLAWPGYADGDVVSAFEKRFHARVEVTLVDSDEALWSRIHSASRPPYDVLAANTAEIQRYARDNLLAPLNLARIPNRQLQLPNFQQVSKIGGLVRGNAIYAVPFTYSSMGLIYDRKQVAVPPH